MSYHEKILNRIRAERPAQAYVSIRVGILRGIREISISPTRPNISFGSLSGDSKAIGLDMKRALEEIRSGD
jgi:hypothetical protein